MGKDSSNREALKYGFELKRWFVNRGRKLDSYTNTSSCCSNLDGGYRVPRVKDITNSVSGRDWSVATPSSTGNYYQRNIGADLFTEWGSMDYYTASGFVGNNYWTNNRVDSVS